jgi:hypothetical protein
MGSVYSKGNVNGLLLARDNLVSHWPGLMDPDCAGAEDEVAVLVYPHLVDALKRQLDFSGIAPGADFEIVFEMFPVPSKQHIHARIDTAPAHAPVQVVGRADVATEEVVRFPRHTVESFK